MLKLYVIGCGGIGGYLIERLPMAIASLSLDLLGSSGMSISKYLKDAGNVALPCIVDRLVLVDADVFNPRNSLRQGAGAGSKLVQRMRYVKEALRKMSDAADKVAETVKFCRDMETEDFLQDLRKAVETLEGETSLSEADYRMLDAEMVRVSFLRKMQLVGYNAYVNPRNITEIIPVDPPENPENEVVSGYAYNYGNLINHQAVVFLCVDNVQTRYEISKYMERFDDCIVINGGNSKTLGHATVYERREGAALDPPLYEIYPDIKPGVDKRPDEAACTDVAPAHDQIAVTNSMVADVMMARFIKWARYGLDEVTKSGNKVRYNDVLIDIEKPSMTPVYHPVS